MPRESRHFGPIDGIQAGSPFSNYAELNAKKVHRHKQAGITGGAKEGAESVVVSGGYADDEDHGSYIIYTGAGGRDDRTKRQIADQDINYGPNASLVKSQIEGSPVRVVRGVGTDLPYAPASGYRYDGVYFVTDHWSKIGKDGYRIVQFRLDQIEGLPGSFKILVSEKEPGPVATQSTVVQRQIRSSAVIGKVKSLHHYRCQICHLVLEVQGATYAEGAHIRGLGRPHLGSDLLSNILCLCPNDHVRFDYGAVYISDNYEVIDALSGVVIGELRRVSAHRIDPRNIAYHRGLWERSVNDHRA